MGADASNSGIGPTNPFPGIACLTGISSIAGLGGINVQALGAEPLVAVEPRIATTPMDFSKLSRDMCTATVPVSPGLAPFLMTEEHQKLVNEESGARAEWRPEEQTVLLLGSAEQVKRAQRLLQRVTTHCIWGLSHEKIRRLLKPKSVESIKCLLAPMSSLPRAEKVLNAQHPTISIGKGPNNHIILPDVHRVVSRQHCILEFDVDRGAVYIHDCSSNGTFLNGLQLPKKQSGKVVLSHGDELLLKDPRDGAVDYGYIVNLTEISVKADRKFEAPKRLVSPSEMGIGQYSV
jgi:hypothetical protein